MNRTRVLVALAVLALLLLPTGFAAAASPPDYRGEIQRARELVVEAIEAHRQGDFSRAYDLAQSAYLDHYEVLEIPLRPRDATHVFEMEVLFSDFRGAIQRRDPVAIVESYGQRILRGLDTDERLLYEPGPEATGIILTTSFVIIFREGLEAAVLVGIILGYLESSRQAKLRRYVYYGVVAAVGGSLLMWGVASYLISVSGLQRELVEAIVNILAVVVLFHVSFWVVRRIEWKRWMEFMRAKVWYAISSGAGASLTAVAFVVVFREGFETVLFYQAIVLAASGFEWAVVAGFAAGTIALLVVSLAILRFGAKLPTKLFMVVTVAISCFLSVALIGRGVRVLQKIDYVPLTRMDGVGVPNPFLQDVLGFYPTWETVLAQVALLMVYILGLLFVVVIRPAAHRAEGVGKAQPIAAQAGDADE